MVNVITTNIALKLKKLGSRILLRGEGFVYLGYKI
jgi:hypothetical protein